MLIGQGVVERLDAQAVTRKQELTFLPVPDRERKHSGEAFDAGLARILIYMENRLGVGPGPISVTLVLEPRLEFRVVVDLTVEDDPGVSVVCRHWLSTARDIDDREPPMGEADGTFGPHAFTIGTTVAENVAHRAEAFDVNRLIRIE